MSLPVDRSWLRKIREEASMSQEQVANKAGISRAYYALLELGIRGSPTPVPTAKAIASALEFDWQGFYDDEKKPPKEAS